MCLVIEVVLKRGAAVEGGGVGGHWSPIETGEPLNISVKTGMKIVKNRKTAIKIAGHTD